MISICPICQKVHDSNPKICNCGYEGIEIFIHEKEEEYWKNQLFHMYKYTKNVYSNKITYEKSKYNSEETDNEIIIKDIDENKGLAILDIDTSKRITVEYGVLALNRKCKSLIINADIIDTHFLDESSIQIIFFGPKVKEFTLGYLRQHSGLRYIFVDTNNKSFMSENHVLYTKDKKELISYPRRKIEEEYIVSKDVKVIHTDAFSYPIYLKKLYLPKNIKLENNSIKSNDLEIIYY